MRLSIDKTRLTPGDVFQISPELKDSFFAGCFMQATEIKSWGVQGFICMPSSRGEMPGHAYFRANWDDIDYVGRAQWIPTRTTEDAQDNETTPTTP